MTTRDSIPVTEITRSGVLDVDANALRLLVNAANDCKVVNNGRTFLYIHNADDQAWDLIIPSQDGVSPSLTVSTVAGEKVLVGPFARRKYNVPFTSDMYVNSDVDDATVLKIAAFRF